MQRIKDLLAESQRRVWLFHGDSITHGAVHTTGFRDYPQLFEERLRFELRRWSDIVIKTAVSGHTTRELLADFDWRCGQFKPAVVFMMVGMNDCFPDRNLTREQFKQNLQELATRIAAWGGLCVMQTTCPTVPTLAPGRQENLADYMQIIRDVARDLQLPLIDHAAHWQSIGPRTVGWMADPFHPNEYGHRAFAKLLFQELGIDDAASKTASLPIP